MNGLLGSFNCPAETFPLPGTTVSLGPATVRSEDQPPYGHRLVINGIPVFPDVAGPGRASSSRRLGSKSASAACLGNASSTP